jgi:uncharacterized protein (UPF0333 family)
MKYIKFVDAKQAKSTYEFVNVKRKLLTTNANIWFNQQTITHHVIPKYVKVKVIGKGPAVDKTNNIAVNIRIKISSSTLILSM